MAIQQQRERFIWGTCGFDDARKGVGGGSYL